VIALSLFLFPESRRSSGSTIEQFMARSSGRPRIAGLDSAASASRALEEELPSLRSGAIHGITDLVSHVYHLVTALVLPVYIISIVQNFCCCDLVHFAG
jgi:hypothetical protein